MENIDSLILSLTKEEEALKRANQANASNTAKKPKRHTSETDEEAPYSDEEVGIDDDEDMEDIDEYGPDLYKDEEDRKRLQALPEVERERILAERSEERQRNLERLEVRKLLKDGRREDITRRSARAKGSSTSQALSELARRREEKNRVRSKRGRNEVSSTSDSRKRRKRYEDQSDYEYSADESPASEDDAEEKAKKRVPQLEEFQSACISRSMIEKWLFAPFFENLVLDGFVRIYIGQDPQKKVPVYRLCQVMEIVPWHKIYTIGENTSCNQALKLKHGKAEKIFTMDIISNQPITQHEYSRFIATLEHDKVRVPSMDHIKQKVEDIKNAREYVLNDKEVNEMIERKRAVKGSSMNAVMEKAQLMARLQHAESNNDTEQVMKLTKELKELEERTFSAEAQKQSVWADINSRNREKDRIEAHQAELREKEARRKALLESVMAQKAAAVAAAATTTATGVASDSSIMVKDTSNKPLAKIVALSQGTFDVEKLSGYQTPYVRLVNKVAQEIKIELFE
ncbi:plus-3-domain-containing protein [Rhizopus microsporus ATCC 52813]|uniref:Plus-3-domain-containing protein n=1 Tax=Rhizopus microsporus ATCC 52813 TaxID=1340429 RepID=A0A2G4T1G4_RHIZD|nr:plus-3-domain-containing protein [Rhizopus microsporus ATCC 52813]PHZ14865.1 plus-3-domain-containing protein [Rhizopus microsporus ATCC 52813]